MLNVHTINEQHKGEIKKAIPLTTALIRIKYLHKFKQKGRGLRKGKLTSNKRCRGCGGQGASHTVSGNAN